MPGVVVGDLKTVDKSRVDLEGVLVYIFNVCSEAFEDLEHDRNVADLGDVLYSANVGGKNCSGKDGNRGVFCAADIDLTVKAIAAVDYYLFQIHTLLVFEIYRLCMYNIW